MSTDFKKKVKIELVKRDMTMSDFAKFINISQPYLSQIIHGKRKAAEQKEMIKKILNIKEEE